MHPFVNSNFLAESFAADRARLNLYKYIQKNAICPCLAAFLVILALLDGPEAEGQTAPQAAAPTASSFQGSVVKGNASPDSIGLSLDDAIQRGLTTNLGVILSQNQTRRF